jgi:hypothetical protein
MRGSEYNPNYFDTEMKILSCAAILFGYLTILFIIVCLIQEYKPFTKLLYLLSNIGIKNKEEID